MVESALSIFVDESGTPIFRTAAESGPRISGYAVCAVAVPTWTLPQLHGFLPRDKKQRLLKASDREFSPEQLTEFLEALFTTDATISLYLLETSSDKNAALSREYVVRVNDWRRSRGNPEVSSVHLIRNIATSRAIRHAWSRAAHQLGWIASHPDVFLDSVTMPPLERTLFEFDLVRIWREQGLLGPKFHWCSIEREPLLRIPDLVASAYRRQASHGDTLDACRVLEGALSQGRIHVEDAFVPPEPPAPGAIIN